MFDHKLAMTFDAALRPELHAQSPVINPSRFNLNRTATLSALILLAAGQTQMAALANPQPPTSSAPTLYATQAEAEKAAKEHFHCSGAHQMGNQWMPCSTHNMVQPNSHQQ